MDIERIYNAYTTPPETLIFFYPIGQKRTNADNNGQTRTKTDRNGQTRTKTDRNGQMRTITDKRGQTRTDNQNQ
ncbi:MAG: hypothetical protein PHC38_10365 [Weeksellaceae bacterium]|nr:hypothetical protein [Weeksellaceae bacterium]